MDNNQSPLSPEEELAQLRQKVAAYEAKEQAQQKKNKTIFKWASKLTSWFFIGPSLKKSVTTLVQEYRNPEQTIQEETVIDVGTNVLKRLTRVGCLGLTIALIPVILLAIQSLLLYQQNEKVDAQNKLITHQNSRLDQQTQLQEAERRSALVFLLGNTLEAINTELKEDYGQDSIRNLSPQLIGQIIALSRSLKPYRFLEDDTLIAGPLSPERGQLLVSLVESQLDKATYNRIFYKSDFRKSDLREAFLWSTEIGGNLSSSNLSFSVLSQANLKLCILNNSNLRNSDMSAAILTFTELREADLREVNFYMAGFWRTDLRKAKVHSKTWIRDLEVDSLSRAYLEEFYYVDTTPNYDYINHKKQLYYLIKTKKSPFPILNLVPS